MNDLISVVIPVYKVENYLNRCIDSVLHQTYMNLEVILVDDGSPDKCGDICDEYSFVDARIKTIHKCNGGLSEARNVGINIAKGRYITFIDSDDWVNKKYIETLYKLVQNKEADISICNFIRTSTETISKPVDEIICYEYSNVGALEQLMGGLYEQMVVAWGKLYKSELFKEIRFPAGKIHEDEFTTYKLLYQANKVVFTTEQLLYYWERPDSIMGTGFKLTNRLHAIEALKERADFFEDMGLDYLRDKTFKLLFGMYKTVNENSNMFKDDDSKNEYFNDYMNFKSKMRKTRQSCKFKLYYESYFISPKLASIVEKFRGK